jgi:Fe-S cluster assembly protein SufD
LASVTPAQAEPEWLTERRRKGASLAQELSLPDPKAKGWEFTDLSELELETFAPDPGRVEGLGEGSPDPGGVAVIPLEAATELHGRVVRDRFGSVVSTNDPFVARNEAEWRHGALVFVPRGHAPDHPVRISVLPRAPGARLDWRALIILEEGAEAEVWEEYGSTGGDGLFNGVTEIVVGDGANLRYVCRQELPTDSWAFAIQRAEVGRDASLEWIALGFGSARGKVRMETKLEGRGSNARVTGAYVGAGRQHLDYDTTQEHGAPNTTSDLAFRGVLAERATAVWRGMIHVDPGAQGTDAFQESRNLLLSHRAHADAIPGLEIEADDVRCTHAAAVAQVDREQLHYLRAHGLPEPAAKRLIIDGFLQTLVERTAASPVRDALSDALEGRLAEVLD